MVKNPARTSHTKQTKEGEIERERERKREQWSKQTKTKVASFENLPFQNKFHSLYFNSATPAYQIRSLNQIAFHFKQNTHQFLPSQTHVSLSLSKLWFSSLFLSLSKLWSLPLSLSLTSKFIFFFFSIWVSLFLSQNLVCLTHRSFLSLSFGLSL